MILRDPVHGLITFESDEEQIIPKLLATSEVQRLRRIRQLGLSSLVFPGAEHTRFAHAIGAAYVMKLFLARLRQLDGDLPFWQRVTSDRARDALAAALLHDVGHGPFSHLFEEAMPGATHHEGWTERILLDPSSEVNRVLIGADPYLPQRVAELVRGHHELPYLANIVSGTFDVDRCDYLLRDAHATGARYGEFDLGWLLRSLRLSDTARGDARSAEHSATGKPGACPTLSLDGTKGLSAIESFLLARHFMFQQVYFHKAARAAEWMVGAILRRAIELVQDGTPLPSLPGAFASAASGESPSLGDYLELDDQVLHSAMHAWENAKDPLLSDLCRRMRARALFKAIELFDDAGMCPGDEEPVAKKHADALEKAREIARQAGLDPHVYVGLDIASDMPYADDDSLNVVFPRGRARSPAEVSFLLARLRGQTVTRVRIIFAPELRTAMREALIH